MALGTARSGQVPGAIGEMAEGGRKGVGEEGSFRVRLSRWEQEDDGRRKGLLWGKRLS